ncbi:MAG: hypothetical protein ABGW78_11980 [Pirellulales bacterium]
MIHVMPSCEESEDCDQPIHSPPHTTHTQDEYPTWSGRHPWIAFIVGPLTLFFTLFILTNIVVGYSLVTISDGKTVQTTAWLPYACTLASWLASFLPSIVAVLIMCRLFISSGRTYSWGVTACSTIALLSFITYCSCTPPQSEPGTGTIIFAFIFPVLSPMSDLFWWQIVQAIVPVVLGIIVLLRNRQTPKCIETDAMPQPVRSAA